MFKSLIGAGKGKRKPAGPGITGKHRLRTPPTPDAPGLTTRLQAAIPSFRPRRERPTAVILLPRTRWRRLSPTRSLTFRAILGPTGIETDRTIEVGAAPETAPPGPRGPVRPDQGELR